MDAYGRWGVRQVAMMDDIDRLNGAAMHRAQSRGPATRVVRSPRRPEGAAPARHARRAVPWRDRRTLRRGAVAGGGPELEIGSGVSSVEACLRLCYEFRKEIAPSVGVEWSRALGDTAD